jgi:hypothetical protein
MGGSLYLPGKNWFLTHLPTASAATAHLQNTPSVKPLQPGVTATGCCCHDTTLSGRADTTRPPSDYHTTSSARRPRSFRPPTPLNTSNHDVVSGSYHTSAHAASDLLMSVPDTGAKEEQAFPTPSGFHGAPGERCVVCRHQLRSHLVRLAQLSHTSNSGLLQETAYWQQ